MPFQVIFHLKRYFFFVDNQFYVIFVPKYGKHIFINFKYTFL